MAASHWEPDEAVCADCMEDEFFQEFIREHGVAQECSYCGRETDESIAVAVDVIIGRIRQGLGWEWEPAVESMPWVDGEYLFRTFDTREVLMEVGFYAGNDALHDRIVGALPDQAWAKRDWQVGSRDEILQSSWQRFSELVKHRHRYLFFPGDREPTIDDPRTPPGQMLDELADMLQGRDLTTHIPEGTNLYRVRVDSTGERYTGLADLCSAPAEEVESANRMSPAGVSAFYASLDPETAIVETDEGRRPAMASVGRFRTCEPIPVVDFVDLPQVPSLFDDLERRRDRPTLIFLHGFVRSLTEPVRKDRRQHIEYVPSQVVTEYLRDRFVDPQGREPSGIRYPSAVRRQGGESIVLFYTHGDFTGDRPFGRQECVPLELNEVVHRELTEP